MHTVTHAAGHGPQTVRRRTTASDKTVDAVEYRLNNHDEIYLVDRAWRAFAYQNGAPNLADRVLGRRIWSFIAGEEVRQTYAALFARVRRRQQPVQFAFRCDAPETLRLLQMRIAPLSDDGLAFKTWVTRRATRPYFPLIAAESPRDDRIVTMCAWCQRFRVVDTWLEAERAVKQLRLFTRATMPRLSHGMCPACAKRFSA